MALFRFRSMNASSEGWDPDLPDLTSIGVSLFPSAMRKSNSCFLPESSNT